MCFDVLATGLNIWLSVVSIGVICTFYSSVVRFQREGQNVELCMSSVGWHEGSDMDGCSTSGGHSGRTASGDYTRSAAMFMLNEVFGSLCLRI